MSWLVLGMVNSRVIGKADAKALLIQLAENADDGGERMYTRSKADFAEILEVSERHVFRLVAWLAEPLDEKGNPKWPMAPDPERGLLEIDEDKSEGGRGRINGYRIVLENLLALPLNGPGQREIERTDKKRRRALRKRKNSDSQSGFPKAAENYDSESGNSDRESGNHDSQSGFSGDSNEESSLQPYNPTCADGQNGPPEGAVSPPASDPNPHWLETATNRHWLASLETIEAALGERAFATWIDGVLLGRDDGEHLTLVAASDMIRERWRDELAPKLEAPLGRMIAVVEQPWARKALAKMEHEGRLPSQLLRARRAAQGDAA